ncbi:MAG TPA: flavoprotein [Kofleriaceae bacterium]|nr:flavoprotein [Kofleriaceae bacterium]
MSGPLVRAPIVRIVDHGTSTHVIGPRLTRRFDGDSAQLLRAVLELYARPLTTEQLFAALAEQAGADFPRAPVDELCAQLVEDGVLVVAKELPPRAVGRRVVVAVSGAIAAVDTPALLRGLLALGCEVRVTLTREARKFVSARALEAITHHAVMSSLWQGDATMPAPHITLAEWAELVIVAPATATTISRIATGNCSDLVAALVCATRAPVMIVPSMNDGMYASPAVQANLATLRTHRRWIVHPALGIEVATPPAERRPLLGPSPPASTLIDIARYVLAQLPARTALPADAAGWEQLWASTPNERLAWHTDDVDAVMGAALEAHHARGRTLLDLGTGSGTIAIAAARRGFTVTATDVSPTALGRARERAGALPILFALDDITATRLPGAFDVAVDCGLLHCLSPAARSAYASAIATLVTPGGALLLVAHQPGAAVASHPLTAHDVSALLPDFALVREHVITLARADARLFELARLAL